MIVKISTDEVHVNWTKPVNDGGCIITGYNLEIDNNNNVFSAVDTNLQTISFVDNYIIDTSSKVPGKVYKIRITAINQVGSSTSTNVAFILASVPEKPAKPEFESDG